MSVAKQRLFSFFFSPLLYFYRLARERVCVCVPVEVNDSRISPSA